MWINVLFFMVLILGVILVILIMFFNLSCILFDVKMEYWKF